MVINNITINFFGVLLHCYLLYQDLYALQFLHTASLVGQDYQEIIVWGVQLTYISTQEQQTVKFIQNFNI